MKISLRETPDNFYKKAESKNKKEKHMNTDNLKYENETRPDAPFPRLEIELKRGQ